MGDTGKQLGDTLLEHVNVARQVGDLANGRLVGQVGHLNVNVIGVLAQVVLLVHAHGVV